MDHAANEDESRPVFAERDTRQARRDKGSTVRPLRQRGTGHVPRPRAETLIRACVSAVWSPLHRAVQARRHAACRSDPRCSAVSRGGRLSPTDWGCPSHESSGRRASSLVMARHRAGHVAARTALNAFPERVAGSRRRAQDTPSAVYESGTVQGTRLGGRPIRYAPSSACTVRQFVLLHDFVSSKVRPAFPRASPTSNDQNTGDKGGRTASLGCTLRAGRPTSQMNSRLTKRQNGCVAACTLGA